MDAERYVAIMIQSLDKKIKILDSIIEKNKAQSILFSAEKHDDETIEVNVKEKGELIEQLELLDSGFEKVYERIRTVLAEHRENYEKEIKQMQAQIRMIMERSTKIQSQEARNKLLADKYFSKTQKHVSQARTNHKVASIYQNTMTGKAVIGAQFMDKKK